MRVVGLKELDAFTSTLAEVRALNERVIEAIQNAEAATIEAALEGKEAEAIAAGGMVLESLQEDFLQGVTRYQQAVLEFLGERPKLNEGPCEFIARISNLNERTVSQMMRKNGIRLAST